MATLEVTITDKGNSVTVVFTDDQKLSPTSVGLKKPIDFEVGDMIRVRTGTDFVQIESIP